MNFGAGAYFFDLFFNSKGNTSVPALTGLNEGFFRCSDFPIKSEFGWYREISSHWTRSYFFVFSFLTTGNANVEKLRVAFLGKKGEIAELMKDLKSAPAEQKKEFGQKINLLKKDVEGKLADLTAAI